VLFNSTAQIVCLWCECTCEYSVLFCWTGWQHCTWQQYAVYLFRPAQFYFTSRQHAATAQCCQSLKILQYTVQWCHECALKLQTDTWTIFATFHYLIILYFRFTLNLLWIFFIKIPYFWYIFILLWNCHDSFLLVRPMLGSFFIQHHLVNVPTKFVRLPLNCRVYILCPFHV
jgi:hypothetical protein